MGHPVDQSARALPSEVTTTLSNGDVLTIRGISPGDIPDLAQIYCESYKANGADEQWDPESASRLLTKLYRSNPGLSVVAVVNEGVVGAAFGDIRPWESGKVILEGKELFVHPDWQKLGIGTELLKERLHRAEVWGGANEVEFITFTAPEGPQGFHENSGLYPVPELQIMAGDVETYRASLNNRSRK